MISGVLEVCKPITLEVLDSGTLEVLDSGTLEVLDSGTLEVPYERNLIPTTNPSSP